jgi:hypothetical protein
MSPRRKDEATLTEEDVRKEHEQAARPGPHWAYLFGVLGGGLVVMLALIGFLGTAS